MYFNLKKAPIYKAVLFKRSFHPGILRFVRTTLFVIATLSLLLYFLSREIAFNFSLPYLGELGLNFNLSEYLLFSSSAYSGTLMIAIVFAFTLVFFEIFYKYHLKSPELDDRNNLAEYLDFDAAVVMTYAQKVSSARGEKEVTPDSFVSAMADYQPAVNLFVRLSIPAKKVQEALKKKTSKISKFMGINKHKPLSPDMQKSIAEAYSAAKERNDTHISLGDILVPLFSTSKNFQKLLAEHNLNKEDVKTLALWRNRMEEKVQNNKRFWTLDNLTKGKPIGEEWVYGYPRLLSRFSRDLTSYLKGGSKSEFELIDRKEEMKRTIRVLLRGKKKNVLLTGEEGAGKKSLVYGLANRIFSGDVPEGLKHKKILEVNVSAVLSSSTEGAEVQNTLSGLLREASSVGNVVLFMENLHNFVREHEGIGASDISQILLPHLNSSRIQIIATTNPVDFHSYISTRGDLLATFEKIDVNELPRKDVMYILENFAMRAERKHNLFFTYQALKAAYDDSEKFIQDIPFPESSLSLLGETVSYVKGKGKNVVVGQDVHEVVKRKTSVPIGDIEETEKEKLINLEDEMHKEIVDQNVAVNTVARAVQRLRAGISRENKPAGVFLFVGPTGVGKTLTAKVLADKQFGSRENMVRLDMSEYQTKKGVRRLLGSETEEKTGELVSAVKDKPFSVILLDEFEKAHADILNVFLRIFDEGTMEDVFGREVNFQNNIIIATSNAGARKIRNMVQEGKDPSQEKSRLIDMFINEGYFKPELLNRFDEIVIFRPLSEKDIRHIAKILVDNMVARLEEKGYYFKPTKEVVDYIAEVGFNPQFGARPMNRAIQDNLESLIARKILEEKVEKGKRFTISVEEIKNFKKETK